MQVTFNRKTLPICATCSALVLVVAPLRPSLLSSMYNISSHITDASNVVSGTHWYTCSFDERQVICTCELWCSDVGAMCTLVTVQWNVYVQCRRHVCSRYYANENMYTY